MSELPPPDPSSASPVPANERIVVLDIVRGLAVLGILVMNVVEFGMPLAAYENPLHCGGASGADLGTWYVQVVLFDGKMRALFSMLFGAGLVLITERMARAGRGSESADQLLRRCLWLALFGVVHRFALQWTGDILYQYGLLGLIAIAFRRWRPVPLLIAGLLCLGAFVPASLLHHHQAAQQRDQAAQAQALETAQQPVPEDLRKAKERWAGRIAAPEPKAHQAEVDAMHGDYTTVFAHRWNYHHMFQSSYLYLYFVWDVLGMVFLGMALCRLGFFAGGLSSGVYWASIAFGIAGAALSFTWAKAHADSGFSQAGLELKLWHDMLYPFVRGIVGLGWASALILLHRHGLLGWLTATLARVGRMAFSNYVMQTVCCTLFFFGYGLGFYAELSRAQVMLVWAAVSLIQIAFSWLWLAQFRYGPLEWVWRSLCWWRLQPLRRGDTIAAADA